MRASMSLNEDEFLEILKRVGFKNPKIECEFGDVDVSFDFSPRYTVNDVMFPNSLVSAAFGITR